MVGGRWMDIMFGGKSRWRAARGRRKESVPAFCLVDLPKWSKILSSEKCVGQTNPNFCAEKPFLLLELSIEVLHSKLCVRLIWPPSRQNQKANSTPIHATPSAKPIKTKAHANECGMRPTPTTRWRSVVVVLYPISSQIAPNIGGWMI